MEHCRENQDPTPALVRAETWLAIAGGANTLRSSPSHFGHTVIGSSDIDWTISKVWPQLRHAYS